jgi:DNA-binding transcriptional LysR family regulator
MQPQTAKLAVTHLCTNFGQAAQFVRLGIVPAILPTIAEPYLGGTPRRIDLPWLKKYCREISVVWHERLRSRPGPKRENCCRH